MEVADPKPMKIGTIGSNLSPMKALPPISAGKKPNLTELNANFLGLSSSSLLSSSALLSSLSSSDRHL
jgi:hypothetical protein